ncbi:uncharacterized protein LOC106667647 [Cimex lectularius]|uniref:Uncharacterized protein n=1 Tax=Cimex lectularius TaxID=79782 RepID=A0A8I6RTH9_CIMLE|nr:uncharacterized protein LOC106667647 [Cimex lectularius]
MYRKIKTGSKRPSSCISDVRVPLDKLQYHSGFYHQNISTTDLEKLIELQYFVYERGRKISKPRQRPLFESSSADSLDLATPNCWMRRCRSKDFKRSRSARKMSFNGPTFSLPSISEIRRERDQVPEMISVIRDLFNIAFQLPGLIGGLLGEDNDLHTLNISDIKAARRRRPKKTFRSMKSASFTHSNKFAKSGSV